MEAEHAKGFQSEPERQVPLLPGQQLPAALKLRLAAADVLWMWSHLLVGKAKIHRYAGETGILCGFFMPRKTREQGHQKDSHADYSVQTLATDWDFQVMSTTNALTSRFWDPSFTLGDCRMDMTDCQD